ncbi:MAG: ABC transporter permease [Bacilli bacterium]|nr:ABC transporter permease [Bacilli bacterium]
MGDFSWVLVGLIDAISLAVIFLFGCIGETINEKAGNLNLGIPGVMCIGAAGGAVGALVYMKTIYKALPIDIDAISFSFGSLISYVLLMLLVIIFVTIFAGLSGLLFSFLTTSLKANQNVTGLALTTFGAGFADFVMGLIRTTENKPLFTIASKIIRFHLPFNEVALGQTGMLLLGNGLFVYLCFALAIVSFLVLNKTRIGLSVRAIGENPATADAAGINTDKYKYFATMIGCAIAGFGGFFYTMSHVGGTWENSATLQGLGWMVLALVIFTVWNPLLAIVGSVIFGFLMSLPYVIPGIGFVEMELIKILPYAVTIIVLIFTSILGKKNVLPPGSLGVNYFREER